jgi:hypothetical protein
MVGTLAWTVYPTHTFQQRFEISDYTELFGPCQHYVVSRRPAVRLDQARVKRHEIRLTFRSMAFDGTPIRFDRVIHQKSLARVWPHRLLKGLEICTYSNGTYFSLTGQSSGEHIFHGDVWTLCALLAETADELTWQEVLYVGQTFGRDGSRHVLDRMREHKKIQQIYSESLTSETDVFLTPCHLGHSSLFNDDDVPESDEHLDVDQLSELIWFQQSEKSRKVCVDIVEHALITYFGSVYNERLRKWSPTQPTTAMRRIRDTGIRTIFVIFGGAPGLAKFFSQAVTSPARAHTVKYQLTRPPHRPSLIRVPMSHPIPIADSGMPLLEAGFQDLAYLAENAPPLAAFFHADLPTMTPSFQ